MRYSHEKIDYLYNLMSKIYFDKINMVFLSFTFFSIYFIIKFYPLCKVSNNVKDIKLEWFVINIKGTIVKKENVYNEIFIMDKILSLF